jgi:hypothetical protein
MSEVVAIMTGALPGDEQTAPADQVSEQEREELAAHLPKE